jgi:hypothetical protein
VFLANLKRLATSPCVAPSCSIPIVLSLLALSKRSIMLWSFEEQIGKKKIVFLLLIPTAVNWVQNDTNHLHVHDIWRKNSVYDCVRYRNALMSFKHILPHLYNQFNQVNIGINWKYFSDEKIIFYLYFYIATFLLSMSVFWKTCYLLQGKMSDLYFVSNFIGCYE